jgi:NAD(P)-dependent dehydrogenase (short-subunit alcohol dehydrogenase family)
MKDYEKIDILINNVGIGKGHERQLSKDGLEMHFAVNYLSHVLLTEELLPFLKNKTSRIINVASVGQDMIDFKNLMLETGYDGFLAYRKSKTALIMYTLDLAERLRNNGINVNAIHPASLMNTKIVLEDWGQTQSTVEEGAEAVESILLTDKTGEYYDCKKLSKAIDQAYDDEARANLRMVTRDLLKNFVMFNA